MADRKEIAKDIKEQFNESMINIKQICEYTGRSRDYMRPLLLSIPHMGKGKDKFYLVIDVARALEKNMFI